MNILDFKMNKKPHITHYKAMYEELLPRYENSQKELAQMNADNIKCNYKLHVIFRKVGRIYRVS